MSSDFEFIRHKNPTFLNESLRNAKSGVGSNDMEKKISGVLLLSNHIEYITRHLIHNFRRLIKVASYNQFNGKFFWPFEEEEEKSLNRASLGALVNELDCFSFPDKQKFLKLLREFNTNRISFIHKLLDAPPEETRVSKIVEDFDNIMARYKILQDEIEKSWPE